MPACCEGGSCVPLTGGVEGCSQLFLVFILTVEMCTSPGVVWGFCLAKGKIPDAAEHRGSFLLPAVALLKFSPELVDLPNLSAPPVANFEIFGETERWRAAVTYRDLVESNFPFFLSPFSPSTSEFLFVGYTNHKQSWSKYNGECSWARQNCCFWSFLALLCTERQEISGASHLVLCYHMVPSSDQQQTHKRCP